MKSAGDVLGMLSSHLFSADQRETVEHQDQLLRFSKMTIPKERQLADSGLWTSPVHIPMLWVRHLYLCSQSR